MDIPKAPTIMYTARLEPNSKVSVQKKLHPFPTKRSQRTTPFNRQSGNRIEEINRWRTDNQTRKLSSRLIYKPRSNKSKKSVKKALDSKKQNYAIHKNKNQMRSIDHLEDSVAVYICEEKKPNRKILSLENRSKECSQSDSTRWKYTKTQ